MVQIRELIDYIASVIDDLGIPKPNVVTSVREEMGFIYIIVGKNTLMCFQCHEDPAVVYGRYDGTDFVEWTLVDMTNDDGIKEVVSLIWKKNLE